LLDCLIASSVLRFNFLFITMAGQEEESKLSGSSSSKNEDTEDPEEESIGLVSPMDIEGPQREMPRARRREDVGSIIRRIYIWWATAPCSLKLKVVVSVLLLVFVNIPLYMSRQNYTDVDVVWDPYGLAGCDILKYNETFDYFMEKIQAIDKPSKFCAKSLVSGFEHIAMIKVLFVEERRISSYNFYWDCLENWEESLQM
jgi:hypothetical protein